KEMRSVSIHLSSRGWCDFSPVVWHGDFETPIEQIINECQSLLKTSHDVDFPNQSDSEIKDKIKLALKERIAKKETWKTAYNEALQIINETSTATKAAYQECKGDPDKLYEDIDNPQYWSVSKYSHALSVKYTYENNYI
ncbi:MAG: hypothetical protein J6N72_05580, partial [Psychrobacter sp.]|nr:hypothetical protein [Psychrobacter sp.]